MPVSLLDQVLPYLSTVVWKLEESFHFKRGVEADDVVQDVALRMQSKLPVVRPDLDKYLPRLLWCACLNRAKDYWRAWERYEPRHCAHEEEAHASKERTPLSKLASQEGRETLSALLTAEQLVVAQLVEDGFSVREIARKLAIGESTVRMRLHAARQRVTTAA